MGFHLLVLLSGVVLVPRRGLSPTAISFAEMKRTCMSNNSNET